jgi:flagellar hook protein FlgE
MMRSMFAGVSGMRSNQMLMDVVGDNIANVNTSGYKASRVVFQDTLSQLLSSGSAGTTTTGSTNPSQVGLGVHVNAVDAIQTQGAIQNTGRATDLAIQGAGYFVMDVAGAQNYTRAGSFNVDANNHLVDASGSMLMGWTATAGVLPGTAGAATDLQIPTVDPTGAVDLAGNPVQLQSFSIGEDGVITGVYGGNPVIVGQLAMASFSNPAGMVAMGNGHFRAGPAAGAATLAAAGTGGVGSLAAGALEMSNVDLAQEFTNMMIAQRAFQANTKVISSSDDMLQELVNLKR